MASKDDFVQQFVKDQMSYKEFYAKAGERDSRREPEMQLPSPARTALLKTPVLKPRVPLPQNVKMKRSSKENVGRERKGHQHQANKETQQKPKKSKLTTADREDEHADRLRERRERRREKRAILHGIPSDRNRDVSPERTKRKKHTKEVEKAVSTHNEKKKATKSSKVPLGIALMESFTAKNAKKDRLTLRPSGGTGVFNKGKASVQTQPQTQSKKIKSGKDRTFHELEFLNKRKRQATPTASLSSVESDSESSDDTPAPTMGIEIQKLKNSAYFNKGSTGAKTQPVSEKRIRERSKSPRASLRKCSSPRSASPVWHIEMDEDLPEDATSVATERMKKAPQPNTQGCQQENRRDAREEAASPLVNVDSRGASGKEPAVTSRSPRTSLHPSQSASQTQSTSIDSRLELPPARVPIPISRPTSAPIRTTIDKTQLRSGVEEPRAPQERPKSTLFREFFVPRPISPTLTMLENAADDLGQVSSWPQGVPDSEGVAGLFEDPYTVNLMPTGRGPVEMEVDELMNENEFEQEDSPPLAYLPVPFERSQVMIGHLGEFQYGVEESEVGGEIWERFTSLEEEEPDLDLYEEEDEFFEYEEMTMDDAMIDWRWGRNREGMDESHLGVDEYGSGDLVEGEYEVGGGEYSEVGRMSARDTSEFGNELEEDELQTSFSEESVCHSHSESTSSPRMRYMEGRALLAGFGASEQRVGHSGQGLGANQPRGQVRGTSAEREVAVGLKLVDHWRPQRL